MRNVTPVRSGSQPGLSPEELDQIEARELNKRLKDIEERFLAAGADFLAPTIADTPRIIDRINRGLGG